MHEASRTNLPVGGTTIDSIEFGVAKVESTRVIRLAASRCEKQVWAKARKRIYACDSFEGLPEKFENLDIGAFATEPPHIPGVTIIKGYFDNSLTDELAAEIKVVAFASLDADLYSSTLCALNWLTPLLRTGSLLLFDEFLGERESEKRAFEKWSADTGCRTILLGQFLREPSGRGKLLKGRGATCNPTGGYFRHCLSKHRLSIMPLDKSTGYFVNRRRVQKP